MTRIYGTSDDLVEFEGDVYGEVGCYDDHDLLITCSDGTVVRFHYGTRDAGIWKAVVLNKGTLFDRIEVCTSEDDDPYSDQIFLRDGVKAAWAATLGTEAKARVS